VGEGKRKSQAGSTPSAEPSVVLNAGLDLTNPESMT